MTRENAWNHEETANSLRRAGEFVSAGDAYAAAGHEHVGHSVPKPFGQVTSFGLNAFLTAATCYRLGGREDRCVNRCNIGILVAEDMFDRVQELPKADAAYDNARRGAWWEYVADFRLVGDLGNVDDAYTRAETIYRDAGDPQVGLSEQEHENLIVYFKSVAMGTAFDVEEWYEKRLDCTLTEWLDYKREHLPELLETVFDAEEWLWAGES